MSNNQKSQRNLVTFMVVPHSGGKSFSWQVSGKLLVFLALVWLFSVGISSYILTQHIDYEMTKRNNIQLTEKNAFFIQELATAQTSVTQVAKMEEELRAMLKLKSRKALLEYTGEGGPTAADQSRLTQILNNHLTVTENQFDESVGVFQKFARMRLESYSEVKKYVVTQRSLMASRPTSWPVRGWITSRFGYRVSPFFEGSTFHQGMDIANEEGTSIKAPADGVVVYCGWHGSYGKLIVLDHGYSFSTRYGHLDRTLVNVGQRIKRGQVIAFLGDTGRSTAPHLHYEIRLNGVPVDPMQYLKF
jgi:murein DD-endopeptidase MepM/ murein hydrolase activator NlpD